MSSSAIVSLKSVRIFYVRYNKSNFSAATIELQTFPIHALSSCDSFSLDTLHHEQVEFCHCNKKPAMNITIGMAVDPQAKTLENNLMTFLSLVAKF